MKLERIVVGVDLREPSLDAAPRRILAPIDDSEFAPKVLTWAERFRRGRAVRVTRAPASRRGRSVVRRTERTRR